MGEQGYEEEALHCSMEEEVVVGASQGRAKGKQSKPKQSGKPTKADWVDIRSLECSSSRRRRRRRKRGIHSFPLIHSHHHRRIAPPYGLTVLAPSSADSALWYYYDHNDCLVVVVVVVSRRDRSCGLGCCGL